MTLEADLRRAFSNDRPPPALWPRICAGLEAERARSAATRRAVRTRRVLAALTATIVLVIATVVVLDSWRTSGYTLAALATRPAEEYRSFVESGRPLDFASSSPAEVRAWLQARLDRPVPTPASGPAGLQLAGARLCWLLERRVASVMYTGSPGPASLYVFQGEDLPRGTETALTVIRRGDLTAVVSWSGDLARVLITPLEPEPARALARLVVPAS